MHKCSYAAALWCIPIYHLNLAMFFFLAVDLQHHSTQTVAAKSVADYPRTMKCKFTSWQIHKIFHVCALISS